MVQAKRFLGHKRCWIRSCRGSWCRFFFFNGERIDKLVKSSTYVEVRKDVKILLGLETVERALRHLPRLEKRLGSDVRKFGGGGATKLQEQIDLARDAIEDARGEVEKHQYASEQFRTERESVEETLREHAAAAPIQRERDRIQRDLQEARDALKAAGAGASSARHGEGILGFRWGDGP